MGIKYVFNPITGNLDATSVELPAGSTTEIQFNDAGAFGGDADLTWNSSTNVLGVTGDVNLSDGGTYTTTLQTITPTAARTISFPDATGTVGLVGGSSGNLVVNQSGAYAGVANSSVDNATGNITLGSRFISTVASASSAPAAYISGTWFAGAAATALPALYVSPAGTSAGTSWSTSGTGFGVNAPAAFAGNLLDLQVNGTSRVVTTAAGRVGIGTTAPGAPLEVVGGNNADLNNPAVFIQNNKFLTFRDTTGFWGLSAYVSSSNNASILAAGNLIFTSGGATERFRFTSTGILQVADAGNIQVGTTTGTKIGTATTQKLGFFDKTPVVQPIAVADATDAATVITQLNALLARMRDLGLIAT